jgi:hypothetical protein
MEVLASDAVHTELGTFVKNMTKAGEGQPTSKLAQAVFREKVHELGITHLLYLCVLSSGGESVTRKWLWNRDHQLLGRGCCQLRALTG